MTGSGMDIADIRLQTTYLFNDHRRRRPKNELLVAKPVIQLV
jgi:hypothetical protein